MGYRGVLKEASWSGMELGKRLAGWRKLYVQRPCGGGECVLLQRNNGKTCELGAQRIRRIGLRGAMRGC